MIGVPDITVILAYIPQKHNIDKDDPINPKNKNNPHPDSLYAHTQHYINMKRKKQLNPYEYIAEVTGTWASDAQDKNHNVILLGDFNTQWTDTIKISDKPIPPNLRTWATALNLIHPAYKQRRKKGDNLPHTYHQENQFDSTKSQHTTIDHILVSPDLEQAITTSGTCTCVGAHLLSDHKPTWITLDIPRKEQIQGTKIKNHLPIELNIDDAKQIEQYINHIKTTYPEDTEFLPITSNNQAETELLQILQDSTKSTVKARGMRTQGVPLFWTPYMKAHHEHFNILLEIKANLTGGKKTRKWTHLTYPEGLTKLIDKWETNNSTIMKTCTTEEKEETLNIKDNTDKKRKCLTPTEWKALPQHELTDTLINDNLEVTRQYFHRSKTKAKAIKISTATATRNKAYEQNKMGKALKSVLGKGSPQSDLKSLPLAQGHTTNPDLIHKIATDSKKIHFQLPDNSHKIAKRIQSDPLLWQQILSGTTRLSSLEEAEGLPKELLDLFQDAVQSNNNNKTLTDQIKEAFLQPLLEEFNKKID